MTVPRLWLLSVEGQQHSLIPTTKTQNDRKFFKNKCYLENTWQYPTEVLCLALARKMLYSELSLPSDDGTK